MGDEPNHTAEPSLCAYTPSFLFKKYFVNFPVKYLRAGRNRSFFVDDFQKMWYNERKDAFKFCDNLRKAYIPADKIDKFKNAFEKPNSYRNPDGSIYVVGTTLVAKRGKSIFSKIFGK